jgi:hypothetical protein
MNSTERAMTLEWERLIALLETRLAKLEQVSLLGPELVELPHEIAGVEWAIKVIKENPPIVSGKPAEKPVDKGSYGSVGDNSYRTLFGLIPKGVFRSPDFVRNAKRAGYSKTTAYRFLENLLQEGKLENIGGYGNRPLMLREAN